MNYCINCGVKRIDNSNFCSQCGSKFDILTETRFDANQKEEIKSTAIKSDFVVNNLTRNKVFSKIIIFFENINGKTLLLYNICYYVIAYTMGYLIAKKYGLTFDVFFILLLFDFFIGGAGYWYRSKQFPNGKIIFCIWSIGLLILEITQVNAILFHIDFLNEYKYFYLLFITPTSWYLILKDNPKAIVQKAKE